MGANERKRRSFERLALVHTDALFATAMRLTRDMAQAEDLVQETFLRAFASFDRFQEGTNCRAWLFRILHNTFVNGYRRKVREARAMEPHVRDRLTDGLVGSSAVLYLRNPERSLQRSLLSDELSHALDELPEEFRLPVVLCDLQDFSYKEIAGIMDCPVGTVMSRLFRGRKLLRERLAEAARAAGFVAPAPEPTMTDGAAQAEGHG